MRLTYYMKGIVKREGVPHCDQFVWDWMKGENSKIYKSLQKSWSLTKFDDLWQSRRILKKSRQDDQRHRRASYQNPRRPFTSPCPKSTHFLSIFPHFSSLSLTLLYFCSLALTFFTHYLFHSLPSLLDRSNPSRASITLTTDPSSTRLSTLSWLLNCDPEK